MAEAQTPTLTGKKWIIAESGISDNIKYGIDQQVKPLMLFYSKDSTNNKVDYSKIEMHFFANGTYQAQNNVGGLYNGTWSLNAANDSLTTDDTLTYKFDFINEFNCITNNATTQVIDTMGTVDTFYTFVKLYGVPDITAIEEDDYSPVKVYPMPATESVTIRLPSKNFKEARLYNLFGQLITTVSLQNKTSVNIVALQHLSAGYYSLEIIDNEGKRIVKKVVKE
jgi:hypothetical protein